MYASCHRDLFNGGYKQCFSLTFIRNISPLRVRELILAQPDPLLHARRDGLTCVWVERRKPTQTRKRRREMRLFLKKRDPWQNWTWTYSTPGCLVATDTILTECTWLRPETTCHMTYHISLAQAPLGLSGQIDTEKKADRMKWRWKMVKQEQVNMQTRWDNVGMGDSNYYAWNNTEWLQPSALKPLLEYQHWSKHSPT